MSEQRYRTGTVLPLPIGQYRVERMHARTSGNTYDLVRTDGTHRMPEVLEGMITTNLPHGARFAPGDHARWKNHPCRVTGRGWNVPQQAIHYTIALDGRAGELAGIPEEELTGA